ncbi:hypothetical protein FAES_1826 [Fibrella aestuarina BUZ 2]|uniref:Uncharacterized protein n=1 Tax=Fibrella aestuarina BUZ 2 TaxID=1166018 RepID=I0K6T3_9BACT|nr:hypothetical protein [Fibrella aestuarina]CCG99836.1 hypothetical protein FAES_1826 [Fibrella aestuarina BUZ 2]
MLRAEIISGYVHGSTAVTVDVTAQGSGTVVLISRGDWTIGYATTTGAATLTVPVTALSAGDVIQASYTERGAGCGIPRLVTEADGQPTGWMLPATIEVERPDGSVDTLSATEYETEFGAEPAAFYDALKAGKVRLPDTYETNPDSTTLLYDLAIEQRAGQTTVSVLPRPNEALLVGYNGGLPISPLPFTVTTAQNVAIAVRRDIIGSAITTRTISLTVLPSAPVGSGVINSASYRYSSSSFLSIYINCAVPVEVMIPGIMSGAYQPGISYDPKFQQVNFPSVPAANRTATIRAVGETNPVNYFSLSLPLL